MFSRKKQISSLLVQKLFEQPGQKGVLSHLFLAIVIASAVFLESKRREAASCRDQATFLALLRHFALPFQAESDTSLPHTESEEPCETTSRSTYKGQLSQL